MTERTFTQCLQDMAWEVIQAITKGERLIDAMARVHRIVQVWEQDRIASQGKDGGRKPRKPTPDDQLRGWIENGDTIPAPIIKACREAMAEEFGVSGTNGYYKRILVKVFASYLEKKHRE